MIDQVSLSPRAIEAWRRVAKTAALRSHAAGVDPSTIPDEQAELLDSGELRIFVEDPSGGGGVLAELVLGQQDWAWQN